MEARQRFYMLYVVKMRSEENEGEALRVQNKNEECA